MHSQQQGKGSQKRRHSPESGQSSRRRLASNDPQDSRLAQVTQGLSNVGLTTASQSQTPYHNLPQTPVWAGGPQNPQVARVAHGFQNPDFMTISRGQGQYQSSQYPPMPNYRSTVHTAAGQLNAEDERKLRTAVASGANFQDIKDMMFSDRFDLSPQILQDRAREIGAEWSPAEDFALLESLELPLNMDDHRYLDRLQAKLREQHVFSLLRSIEDIKARVKTLMDIGEDYYLRNPPAEASSPYIPTRPAVNPAYQTPNTSSSQPGTASQSLVSPSSRLPRGYDNPQAVSQPVLGYASGGSKPGSSVAGHGQVESHFDNQWTDQNLDVIKVKMARCYTLADIARGFTPRRKAKDIESILTKIGYEEWSDEQDNHLLKLQQDIGDNCVEIRKRLSGPERKEAEIQGRLRYLSERPPNLNKQRRKRPHEYTVADDTYICLQVARGISYKSMCRERFSDVIPYNLEKRAKMIGAKWSEDDNQKLRDEVLRYGNAEVDWGSIGEKYTPPRRAEAVHIRWRHLRGVL